MSRTRITALAQRTRLARAAAVTTFQRPAGARTQLRALGTSAVVTAAQPATQLVTQPPPRIELRVGRAMTTVLRSAVTGPAGPQGPAGILNWHQVEW